MADLPSTARVAVVGGGAVGVSCLYHLAKAGWTDCVLLERDELTSGSTWHAAGNCPTFSTSETVLRMQAGSASLYRALAAEAEDAPIYHVTGSLRLAHGPERMREFAHVAAMARRHGVEMALCTPEELRARYPFLETHGLAGGLWDPLDGDIDPASLTQALASRARAMGAHIVRRCPVTAFYRSGGEWLVETALGTVHAGAVVNAAGYRAAEVGAMLGREVPMAVMSHQYVLFEEVPEVAARTAETGAKLPLLRDVDSSWYLRQEKGGFNLGPYERDCRAHWTGPDDPMPEDFAFGLFPDDLDRISWHLEDAMARVPLLGTAGMSKVINGPIPYTPDGNPLIGPMPGVPDAFEACVFSFGIAQAGGAGKLLAEWVTEGAPRHDALAVDPRRFGAWADPAYCRAKAREVYGHEYAMHFPRQSWPAGRPKRLGPLTGELAALGAQFVEVAGWERADWFAAAGDDTSAEARRTWARAGPWEPRIRAECEAVREGLGVANLPGLARFRVEGMGLMPWLAQQVTGALPGQGSAGCVYMADERGRFLAELVVLCDTDEEAVLFAAAPAQEHVRELLVSRLSPSDDVVLRDITETADRLVLLGPRAQALLERVCPGEVETASLGHLISRIAGRFVRLLRLSHTGEPGWELHARAEDMTVIWEEIWREGRALGIVPVGIAALDSLRMEAGIPVWGRELSPGATLLELGLDRFLDLDKSEEFPGKAALQAEREAGPARRLVAMRVEAGPCDAPPGSPVRAGGETVGVTTSGAWGYRTGSSVALGFVQAEAAVPGSAVEVEIFGERYPATLAQPGAL